MKINLEKVHSLWLVFQVKNTLLNVKAWRQHCLRKMSSKKLTPTLSFRCIFLFAKLSKWQKTLWLGIFRCGSISRRTFRCSLTELINYSSWEKPWFWILWISAMSWIQLLEWMPISSSCMHCTACTALQCTSQKASHPDISETESGTYHRSAGVKTATYIEVGHRRGP